MEEDVYVSVMAQYFPTFKANKFEEINRKLSIKEYKEIEKYIYLEGIENGYMQDLESNEEKYVPKFT